VNSVNRKIKTKTEEAKPFKRKFDAQLRHVKVILMQCRKELPHDQWLDLLGQTKISVTSHPEQFFGTDLPNSEITREAIRQVFDGFLRDIEIRNVQAFRKPGQ
jgi:hypothetical protein